MYQLIVKLANESLCGFLSTKQIAVFPNTSNIDDLVNELLKLKQIINQDLEHHSNLQCEFIEKVDRTCTYKVKFSNLEEYFQDLCVKYNQSFTSIIAKAPSYVNAAQMQFRINSLNIIETLDTPIDVHDSICGDTIDKIDRVTIDLSPRTIHINEYCNHRDIFSTSNQKYDRRGQRCGHYSDGGSYGEDESELDIDSDLPFNVNNWNVAYNLCTASYDGKDMENVPYYGLVFPHPYEGTSSGFLSFGEHSIDIIEQNEYYKCYIYGGVVFHVNNASVTLIPAVVRSSSHESYGNIQLLTELPRIVSKELYDVALCGEVDEIGKNLYVLLDEKNRLDINEVLHPIMMDQVYPLVQNAIIEEMKRPKSLSHYEAKTPINLSKCV